jgi:hypothetical protein
VPVLAQEPNVRNCQRVHEPPQVPVRLRPKDKVPVIGHQAVAQQAHRLLRKGDDHHPQKGCVVGVVLKNRSPFVTAIEHMKHHATGLFASGSMHYERRLPG